MNNFIFSLVVTDPCKNIAVLKTILFVKKLINIVFILVPMVLIVMLCLDFAKNVMASAEDEMRKNLKIAIKRLIYIVCLFLVPTVVDFAMIGLGSFNTKYKTCYEVDADAIERQIAANKAECISSGDTWNESALECEIALNPASISSDSDSSGNGSSSSGSSNIKASSKSSQSVVDKMDSLFQKYNDKLHSDRKAGKHWIYTNNHRGTNHAPQNAKFSVNASQPDDKLGCNCATSANWVLKDMGVIKEKTKFYGGSKGELRVNNMSDLKKNTNIYHYKNKTVKECIKEGKIVPGDIICTKAHTFTYMGDYIFDTGHGAKGDKTHGKYVGKKYGNRSEYKSDYEFYNWIMKKGTKTYSHDLAYKAYTVIRVKKSFKV